MEIAIDELSLKASDASSSNIRAEDATHATQDHAIRLGICIKFLVIALSLRDEVY